MLTRWRVASVLAVGVVLGSLVGQPATAAPMQAASGSVTLYETTTFGGDSVKLSYLQCAGRILVPAQLEQVGSYDNRPPVRCQVALVGPAGSHVLCAGRAVVPPQFRNATFVRINLGISLPCRPATAGPSMTTAAV